MLQGRGAAGIAGVIVDLQEHQQRVLHVRGRGDRFLHHRGPQRGGQERRRPDEGEHDRHGRGRQQAFEGVQPVPGHAEGPAALQAPHEGPREEEGGQEEEDVHPAGDPAEPDVVDRDQSERDRSQAVQLVAEDRAGVARLRGGRRAPAACTGGIVGGGRAGAALLVGRDPGAGDGIRRGPGVLGLPFGVQLDRALEPVIERGRRRRQRPRGPRGELGARRLLVGLRGLRGRLLGPVIEGIGKGGHGGGLGLCSERAGDGGLAGLLLRAERAGAAAARAPGRRGAGIVRRTDRDPLPCCGGLSVCRAGGAWAVLGWILVDRRLRDVAGRADGHRTLRA